MGKYLMRDSLCYTSTDMVNWTGQGTVASLRNFKWAVVKEGDGIMGTNSSVKKQIIYTGKPINTRIN
jgi:hypothetical protein